ncbi:MAG: DNA topoisomerase III [Clostridia bacterium]|nr:DNA topoisomerase III [Clostridia bacterium]
MGKKLVLAEKPSVGRDLARVLNCRKKGSGFFEGDKYIVTWALGHLVELASPERYEDRYKSWRIEDLPILPKHLKLDVIKKTGKQFHSVKTQMHRKDVQEIIIATDAGREGELVARWIIDKAHIKKPIKRLWISSVTDKAIKEGFSRLKNGKDYENLYASAVARAEADWVVGINATRALTCKYNAQLSCGRVQTPTLAMVQKREEEIKNFKSKKYYGITALAKDLKLTWHDSKTKDHKTFDEEKCDRILSSIQNKDAVVQEITKTHKKAYASKLYDLTELQRDANKIYDFSPKETLSIMQRLYESHKILTYPRTDSRYISSDIVETLKDRIKACGVGPYSQFTHTLLKGKIVANKSFVDNTKVSDHHAIIPTEQRVYLEDLSDKERKIYDLVIKRFLAVLYPPFESEQISIKCSVGDEPFSSKGRKVLKEGWKVIYGYDDDGDEFQKIGDINKGETIRITQFIKTDGMTTPPAPFNEGTLLSAMENPIKYLDSENKKWSKTLGETGGLGTVATRADILEKLFNSFLIEKKGKDIYITSKGKQLLNLVPEDLKSPVLTAQWEQKLSGISKGNLDKNLFINDMKQYAKEVVSQIKNSEEKFKHDNMTKNKCPECGKYMLEVNSKTGKMLVCQDRACGYRKMIAKITNARCPNCHKKLELRGEGESQIFACVCGHREKLSAFNERKKKEKNQLSKKDVSRYLKQQNKKEEPLNTALADALQKFKQKNH